MSIVDANKRTENEIRLILINTIATNGLRETGRQLGFSYTYLRDVAKSDRRISKDLADALGFERFEIKEVYFIKKKTANDAETEKEK